MAERLGFRLVARMAEVTPGHAHDGKRTSTFSIMSRLDTSQVPDDDPS